MNEVILFFIPIVLMILMIIYMCLKIKKDTNRKGILLQTIIVNVIISIIGSSFWFYHAIDGVSQMVGIAIYVLFLIVSFIVFSIFYQMKETNKKLDQ